MKINGFRTLSSFSRLTDFTAFLPKDANAKIFQFLEHYFVMLFGFDISMKKKNTNTAHLQQHGSHFKISVNTRIIILCQEFTLQVTA